jgi:hypothetical protein
MPRQTVTGNKPRGSRHKSASVRNVTALDEAGKPVEWFFIYKVPKLVKGANIDDATGYEYVITIPPSTSARPTNASSTDHPIF